MDKRRFAQMLIMTFFFIGILLSTSNYEFNLNVTHEGDWETVEHIEGIQDLNFVPSATGNDYVDATQSQLYGTTTNMPPTLGMGYSGDEYSTLTEASYAATIYPDKTTYTGGSLPSGWTNSNWVWSSTYVWISGFSSSSGYFYTNTHDMSSYLGVRVRFSWRTESFNPLEASDFESISYEGSSIKWFECDAGSQLSWTVEQRDSAWHSTGWYCRWNADGLVGTVENYEGINVDNIYLEGKSSVTYYRFEAVYRFDTVDYAYTNISLWVSFETSSTDTFDVYGGLTATPTTLIANSQSNTFHVDVSSTCTGTPYYIKVVDEVRTGDTVQSTWKIGQCFLQIVNTAPTNDANPTIAELDDTEHLYSMYQLYNITTYHSDGDGFGQIDYVNFYLYNDTQSGYYFVGRFTQSTHAFLEYGTTDQKARWYLDTSESSYSEHDTNELDITWKFWVEYVCPDVVDFDIRVIIYDDAAASTSNYYDELSDGTLRDCDIETDLEWDTIPTVTGDDAGQVDRGDLGETFYVTGDVSYEGSTLTPHSDHMEVMVYRISAGSEGPWWDYTLDANGEFNVTCLSEDSVGSKTYEVKVEENGHPWPYTDLVIGDIPQDTYIADRINVTFIDADGVVVDPNTQVNFTVSLEYEVGGAAITAGTFSLRYGSTYLTLTHDVSSNWTVNDVSSGTTSRTYDYVNGTETTVGLTGINLNSHTVSVSWDKIILTIWINHHWTVIGYNTTIWATGVYDYAGWVWNGTVTYNSTAGVYPVESTVANYTYVVQSISDPDYGITTFSDNDDVWCIFDDAEVSSITYDWFQQDVNNVWLIVVSGTWTWTFNATTIDTDVDGYCILQSKMNATGSMANDDWGIVDGTGQIGDLIVGSFGTDAYYANISINCVATINGTAYDWQVWQVIIDVDILHSIHIENFNIEPTDYYFWITYQTNWNNASITIWDDAIDGGTAYTNAIYWSAIEGMHQFSRSEIVASHNITILINGSATAQNQQIKDYSTTDYWWWYNFTYVVVAPTAYDCHIVIIDNLFELVPFDTFEVYMNDTRIYHDTIQVTNGYVYNISIANRFGDTVNETIFSAGHEMVVFVTVYSFKFMNWYNGFLRINVTRAGVIYSEIIMPMEIVEFNLYSANYDFDVDFLNGTVKHSFNIDLTNSTGYIITGDTLADVFDLVDSTNEMVTAINITVTTIEDDTLTIQLMFDWSNTTLYNQTINIISAFNWDNTTLYNQTISLAAAFNATNTVLYDQIILIQNMFEWDNTTLYNQTISILNAFNSTNTVIYSQTVSILANVSNVNSTIYSQTLTILTDISNVNSTLYSQTLSILTDISNVNSTLYSQTVTLLADISNVNSTIFSQTVSILSNITNVNSTIYSQTVDILSYVWNSATSIYNQTVSILSDIQNTNATIYTQTVSILSQITNINSTIYSQTVDILNYVWNNATSIYNQTITLLADISNVNSTLYSQTVTLLADISNIDSDIVQQTIDILADISNVNTTIYSQTVQLLADISNVNSTLYSQTVTLIANIANLDSDIVQQTIDILADISNVNSTIYTQTVQMLTDISNVNTTLYSQTVTMLANIANIDSDIVQQTIDILADISNVNSTIYAQTVTLIANIANLDADIVQQTIDILADISNVNSTIYDQTVTLLADIANTNSTIYAQTVTLIANIANLDSDIIQQTIDILADISNVNSTIYSQTVSILSNITNTNSTIYAQTVSILSAISNMNTTIYSQTVSILADIQNVNSTLYAQTVTLLANITNMNSTLYTQTISILADIQNVNSTLYTQTIQVLTDIQNMNTTLYSQTITILSQITNMNSTIYSQTLTILSNVEELNATLYLVDDPAHLNPLILGSKLSDDYCDFTVVTNWHNSSITIYDNDAIQSGPLSELLSPIRYPLSTTGGTHNLSVFIDAGADSFWYNISYTVAETAFRIDNGPYTETDTTSQFSGYANLLFNYTVYNNDSIVTTGSKADGTFSITWSKNTTAGLHFWGIMFNSSNTIMWVNGSYESYGVLILNIYPGQDNDTIYIAGRLFSSDLTLSYWVWENTGSGDVLVGSGNINLAATTAWFTLYWDKSAENVAANWTLTITDGSNNSTAWGWYTKMDAAVTNITNNASHYEDQATYVEEQTVVEGDAYEGPSPEAAMWQSFSYIGLTFGMVFLVAATYYAAQGWKGRRRKRDRGNDWLVTRR